MSVNQHWKWRAVLGKNALRPRAKITGHGRKMADTPPSAHKSGYLKAILQCLNCPESEELVGEDTPLAELEIQTLDKNVTKNSPSA